MERSAKVLLVDDEPFMMLGVARTLGASGFEVAMCSEWTEIARVVRTEEPDLVLLDLNMPGLKGDSICAILKRNAGESEVRIALWSSEPASTLARIARECGADGSVTKNTSGESLVERVRELISLPPRPATDTPQSPTPA